MNALDEPDMPSPQAGCNHRRAFTKMAVVFVLIVLAVAGLSHFVTDDNLDLLKHNLSLWSIIALVLIINLVSFASFLVLFMAWQWVRYDFKRPPESKTGHEGRS